MPFSFPPFHFSPYYRYQYPMSNRPIPTPEPAKKVESTQKNRSADIPNNAVSHLFSFLPSSIGPLSIFPDGFFNQDKPVFEMFGIRLFLDDIIIICLLIFLYQEQVNDQMLYICLFLLLLS